MKKLTALVLICVVLLSFASCKIGEKSADGKKDNENTTSAVSGTSSENGKDGGSEKSTKPRTTVDYSRVLKDLNRKETKFVDTLGVTEEGKKIVAFFGDDFETQFIVVEFKDGKANLAKNYRFFKDERKYEAYAIVASKDKGKNFTDHKEEMCIEQLETKKYRGKTYDEVMDLLHGYDLKR